MLAPDSRIVVADMGTGEAVSVPSLRPGDIDERRQTDIALSPSDDAVYAAAADAPLTRWTLRPADWIRVACATSDRPFDQDAWRELTGILAPASTRCG